MRPRIGPTPLLPAHGVEFLRSAFVWRCPVHGLIESPRQTCELGENGHVWLMVCPINLSSDEGITDAVCDEECSGPFEVRLK